MQVELKIGYQVHTEIRKMSPKGERERNCQRKEGSQGTLAYCWWEYESGSILRKLELDRSSELEMLLQSIQKKCISVLSGYLHAHSHYSSSTLYTAMEWKASVHHTMNG